MAGRRYRVHRISTLPLARFGCVLGGLAMLAPAALCAAVSVQVIAGLRFLLAQWQGSELDMLGVPVEFDFVTLLGLETTQTLLARLDDQRGVVMLLIILLGMVGGGLFIALTTLLVGWGYNLLAALTGGLEVELRE